MKYKTLQKCMLLFIFIPFMVKAQYPTKYWIHFTDKNNNAYSISNPSAFLSARALQRRTNQNIPVITEDLPVTQAYVDSILTHGASVINRSKWFNSVTIQTTDTNILNSILALPFVQGSTAVGRLHSPLRAEEKSFFAHEDYTQAGPTQPVQPQNLSYGLSYNQIAMCGGDQMHNLGYQGQGMVIAVLDAGFLNADTLHAFDSLRANNQILGTWDFVANDASVYEDYQHGMMVLSTMGGNLPGELVGTAPKASYWLLRTEEAATEYLIEEANWASGAEFADSVGADLINTSLGYTEFDDATQNHTYSSMDGNTTIITQAADKASAKGILVVCSAGNEGAHQWNFIGAPADADSVLTVGAVDSARNYAPFSSNGPSFDGRVKPDVADEGWNALFASTAGGTQYGSGTSFASPIMCGMAACLWQANPSMTAQQIRNAIIQSADQYSNPDTLLGYGIPNFMIANLVLSGKPLSDFTGENLMKVFPNPFNDQLWFDFYSDSSQILNYELFDGVGRSMTIGSVNVGNHSYIRENIPTKYNLAKGTYYLRVVAKNRVFVRSLVKI